MGSAILELPPMKIVLKMPFRLTENTTMPLKIDQDEPG